MSEVRSTLGWLGFLCGIMSIVMLLKNGYSIGWSAALGAIVDYYDALLQVAFGWLHEGLLRFFSIVSGFLGFEIKLAPGWRYIFVLLLLFFGALARNVFQSQREGFIRFAVLGGLTAVVASVGFGVVAATEVAMPLSVGAAFFGIAFMLAPALSVVGLDFYALRLKQASAAEHFWRLILYGFLLVFCAVFFTLVFYLLPMSTTDASYSSSVFFVASYLTFSPIVSCAVLWIVAGGGGPHRDVKLDTGVGWGIFGTFVGAAAFLATNAGLRFAGL